MEGAFLARLSGSCGCEGVDREEKAASPRVSIVCLLTNTSRLIHAHRFHFIIYRIDDDRSFLLRIHEILRRQSVLVVILRISQRDQADRCRIACHLDVISVLGGVLRRLPHNHNEEEEEEGVQAPDAVVDATSQLSATPTTTGTSTSRAPCPRE